MENQLRLNGIQHSKDRTILAQLYVMNITRFVFHLAGNDKENLQSKALEAWKPLITDGMLQRIVKWTNQKISQIAMSTAA